MANNETTRTSRVLLLASYCGEDNPLCSDALPCLDCLKMCNVVTFEGTITDNAGDWDRNRSMLDGTIAVLEDDKTAELRAVLKSHHDWHQAVGTVLFPAEPEQPGPIEIDLSAEYADSTLCERTLRALS